jgi:hypothetical protein
MLPVIMGILGIVAKPIMGWFTHKADMQKTKQAAEIEWAKEMAKGSANSWKDEYLTLLWTLPILLAMFGYTAPLENLLIILKQIPEWYTYLLLVITLASFGLSVTGRWKDIKMVQDITVSRQKRLNGASTQPSDAGPKSHGTDFEIEENE